MPAAGNLLPQISYRNTKSSLVIRLAQSTVSLHDASEVCQLAPRIRNTSFRLAGMQAPHSR